MARLVSVDGNPLHDGDEWMVSEVAGWWDSPALRTGFTARPSAAGAYYAPAFMDSRVLTVTGRLKASDPGTLAAMKRRIGALCIGPTSLYEFQVTDESGSWHTMVQRSDAVQFSNINSFVCDYQAQFTAPDPRILSVQPFQAFTTLAQPGAGGAQWNGHAGGTGTEWNGSTGNPNLVANGNFYSGIAKWSGRNGATVVWVDDGLHGVGAAKATSTTTASATGLISDKFGGIVAGTTYMFSADVKVNQPTTLALAVDWYDAANTLLSTTTAPLGSVAASAGWQTYDSGAVHTAPASATQARIYVDGGTLALGSYFVASAVWFAPINQVSRSFGLPLGQPSSDGTLTVDNRTGTGPADLTLTITGPVTNPKLTTILGSIAYNGDLAANDTLVINTGTGSVLLNGANRRGQLSQAQWFQCPGGSTLDIRFTADLDNDQALLGAQWFITLV